MAFKQDLERTHRVYSPEWVAVRDAVTLPRSDRDAPRTHLNILATVLRGVSTHVKSWLKLANSMPTMRLSAGMVQGRVCDVVQANPSTRARGGPVDHGAERVPKAQVSHDRCRQSISQADQTRRWRRRGF